MTSLSIEFVDLFFISSQIAADSGHDPTKRSKAEVVSLLMTAAGFASCLEAVIDTSQHL